jgi:hypothetical protein
MMQAFFFCLGDITGDITPQKRAPRINIQGAFINQLNQTYENRTATAAKH